VVEINQTCANAVGGCFSGDSQFLPVTIDGSAGRSYRLTSDLYLGSPVFSGIVVSAPDVSIDLGGFAIRGLNVCNGLPGGCAYNGSGVGVRTVDGSEGPAHRLSLKGGAIVGLGGSGLNLDSGGSHSLAGLRIANNGASGIFTTTAGISIEHAASEQNGGIGISVGGEARISNSSAARNGGVGIFTADGAIIVTTSVRGNAGRGITVGHAGRISETTSTANGADGIRGATGTHISRSSAYQNLGAGIWVDEGSAVIESIARGNSGDGIHIGLIGSTDPKGSIVRGCTVTANGVGIWANYNASIQDNVISDNTGYGLVLGTLGAYRGNVIESNGGLVSFGSGSANLGGNHCADASDVVVPCP
jgi:hypothetical protein